MCVPVCAQALFCDLALPCLSEAFRTVPGKRNIILTLLCATTPPHSTHTGITPPLIFISTCTEKKCLFAVNGVCMGGVGGVAERVGWWVGVIEVGGVVVGVRLLGVCGWWCL